MTLLRVLVVGFLMLNGGCAIGARSVGPLEDGDDAGDAAATSDGPSTGMTLDRTARKRAWTMASAQRF